MAYSLISLSSSTSTTILTFCLRTFTLTTSPLKPSKVLTFSPMSGQLEFNSSYASCSFLRQHINLPQIPEIFVGLSERLCSFAILIDTGINSDK